MKINQPAGCGVLTKMKLSTTFKLVVLALVSIIITTGCSLRGGIGGSPSTKSAIRAAEASVEKARANNWVWRDTEKLLKKAKEASKKGENEIALKLANQAKDQAELAIKQYEYEKSQDRSRYIAR